MAYENGIAGTHNDAYTNLGFSYGKQACQTMAAQVVPYTVCDNSHLAIQPLGPSAFVSDKAYAGTIALYNPSFASNNNSRAMSAANVLVPANCNSFITTTSLTEQEDATSFLGVFIEESTAETPMTTIATSGVVDLFNNSDDTIKPLQVLRYELPVPASAALANGGNVPAGLESSHRQEVYPLASVRATALPATVAFPIVKAAKRGTGGIDDPYHVATEMTNPIPRSAAGRHLAHAFDALDRVYDQPKGYGRSRLATAMPRDPTMRAKFIDAMQHLTKALDADRRSIIGVALTGGKKGQRVRVALKRYSQQL